jgi:hypothetical protein
VDGFEPATLARQGTNLPLAGVRRQFADDFGRSPVVGLKPWLPARLQNRKLGRDRDQLAAGVCWVRHPACPFIDSSGSDVCRVLGTLAWCAPV